MLALAVLAGLCFAPVTTTQIAVLDEVAPRERPAEAFSWLAILYGAGSAAGAALGGQLVERRRAARGDRRGVRGDRAGVGGDDGAQPGRSARRQARLEPVDRLDADRVGAAQHREVERDEVAEQRRARRAAAERVSPRGATRSTAAAWPPTISAVSSIRAAIRSPAPGSSRKTAAKRAKSLASAQPTISLWPASGSSAANAGSFAFSLNWHFQR